MKSATIFHGRGSSPDEFWFPYLQRELEARGYSVRVPELPEADMPDLANWLPIALEGSYDAESVLVGHSAGCPLMLALLQRLAGPVRQTVLVAGFARSSSPQLDAIVQDEYDWRRIRANAGDLIIINSDDDPYGCDERAGRDIFDHLGGTLIIRHGEGHMGSKAYNQPYREFPLLLKLIG